VPPHFSIPPENVEVMPGGSVNLTCVAIGSPMPFVKWRLGALELTPEDNIPIGKNVLMLNDIRESATYTCVAASDLGNIESDAEVRVKGRIFLLIIRDKNNNRLLKYCNRVAIGFEQFGACHLVTVDKTR